MASLVISSSLNPQSRSRLLALIAFKTLKNTDVSVDWLDLADHSIPLCDGDSTYKNSKVKELREKIQNAKGILFAVPIYNYDVNAAAKNLIKLRVNKLHPCFGSRGSEAQIFSSRPLKK